MPKNFVLPDLGEGIKEAQIIRVMVKKGDQVATDQYLMEVETDKAAVEIPSPYAGIVTDVRVKEGQTVNVGDVMVSFDDGSLAVSAPKSAPTKTVEASSGAQKTTPVVSGNSPRPAMTVPAAPPIETTPPARGKSVAPAAPAVRKLAREMDIDIDGVAGTGQGGRVTKEDLERHASRMATSPGTVSGGTATSLPTGATGGLTAGALRPPQPATQLPGVADVDKWGSVRKVPLSQIRKTIATQMAKSAFTIPHVTHGDEADITGLDRMRRELTDATGGEVKLTVMTFVIRAVCIALRRHPIFNVSFDQEGGQLIYKDYINMGIAVDSERGLIVPVIRDVDKLSMRNIAAALRGIAEKIRTNHFAIEDLRGGTFTITNVGALGGTFSTPIINHPEVAILGLGRSRKIPVFRDGNLAEAFMLPLALSFDHRATDGANAARFTREIISYLETPARFLLD